MSSSAAASLHFLSLTPKTLSLFKSKITATTSLCLFKPTPPKPLSISPSFPHSSSNKLFHAPSSRFGRNFAVSSKFEQLEDEEEDEDLSDVGEERSFSRDLKLFVGNLPFSVDSAALAGLFERAGNVEMVEVIYDKFSGRSRGFGFVTMSTVEEVDAAVQQFNGYEIDGRPLRVNSGPPPPRNEDSSFRGARGDSSFRGARGDSSFRGAREDSYFRGGRGDSSFRGGRGDSSFGGARGGASFDNSNRVHVGNLAWDVDNLALETLFSEQGKVMEAKVLYDRDSGRSRGFGFVSYSSADEVNSAIESLDGADLNGRSIRVSLAESKPRRQF